MSEGKTSSGPRVDHDGNARDRRWRLRAWRQRLERAAIASGNPRRTAAAFAFGVFLSFSPLVGLQIAIGMAAAFALRMSRPTVFLGLCTNLPAIMVPWYVATTAAGAFLLEIPLSADFGARLSSVLDIPAYRAAFWQQTLELVWPLGSAFLVGSTAGALLLGCAAYVVTARFLGSRQPRIHSGGTEATETKRRF